MKGVTIIISSVIIYVLNWSNVCTHLVQLALLTKVCFLITIALSDGNEEPEKMENGEAGEKDEGEDKDEEEDEKEEDTEMESTTKDDEPATSSENKDKDPEQPVSYTSLLCFVEWLEVLVTRNNVHI